MVDTLYNLLAMFFMGVMLGFRLGWGMHKADRDYLDRQRLCKCRHMTIHDNGE